MFNMFLENLWMVIGVLGVSFLSLFLSYKLSKKAHPVGQSWIMFWNIGYITHLLLNILFGK